MGVAVDTFDHSYIREDNDVNYTVILPQDWSFGTEYGNGDEDRSLVNPLNNIRWAHVFDQGGNTVLDVFYSNKPLGFEDGFKLRIVARPNLATESGEEVSS
jgi:hypothetical protein